MAVELDVAAEVFGARRKAIGEEMNELVFAACEKRVVGAALLADGGGALVAHLASAKRASAVSREDLGVIGEFEELFLEALIEERGELLRGVVGGEIGAADIADEESVSCEDRSGLDGSGEIREDGTDPFDGMAGGVEEVEAGIAELEGVAVFDGDVRKGRVGIFAEVDSGAGALGELVVAGDEVGVEMRLDDVLDAEIFLGREVEVEVNVALRVDNGSDAIARDDVGGVGEAAEEELLDQDWFHVDSLGLQLV